MGLPERHRGGSAGAVAGVGWLERSLLARRRVRPLDESQAPAQIRLNTFDGRPVYRFQTEQGEHIVYADTGEEQLFVSNEMIQRVASAWTGQPVNTATVEAVEEVDQWTVGGALRTLRPMWKYSWPNGEQVYISGDSGEVVQYTTTASRLGAYLGPIPHWLYFTPLRKHPLEWTRVVIWTSGIGTFSAILGVIIGIWMYSPSKRYRNAGVATSIPYRGQKRWHTVLGLIFGVATATWALSGMLSMDPFPARTGGPAGSRGTRDGGIPQALRGGMRMEAFSAKHPREALARLENLDVKELEFTTFAGEAAYLARLSGGTRIVPVAGEPDFEFDRRRIIDVVTKAAGPGGLAGIGVIDQYDMYYLDRRRQRPLPVILARLNDAEHTRYYIDPKTARVVGDLQLAKLGDPLGLPRAAFAGFSVALQLPPGVGHRRDHVHGRRHRARRDLTDSGVEGAGRKLRQGFYRRPVVAQC